MTIVLLGAGAVSTTTPWYLRKTGHGDTVRGLDQFRRKDLSPWSIAIEGDRIYGRGTTDNKGQHSINIAARSRQSFLSAVG